MAPETFSITSFLLLFIHVCSQTLPHPTLPPFGCANFGVCPPLYQNVFNGYFECSSSCMCNEGTQQVDCSEQVNLCDSSPCSIDGGSWLCTPMINNYNCSCHPDYTGSDCKMLLTDPCYSSPCESGGTCKNVAGNYVCDCPSGRKGDRCQYNDICAAQSDKCKNGGTCEMIFHGEEFFCHCATGWQGRICDQAVSYANEKNLGCWKASEALASQGDKTDLMPRPSPDKCRDLLVEAITVNKKNYDTYSINGKFCYLSLGNIWNETASNGGCNTKCSVQEGGNVSFPGANDTCGSYLNKAAILYSYSLWTDPKQCVNLTCGDGVCIEKNNTATCLCPRERKGSGTASCATLANDPCFSNPCSVGSTCTSNLVDFSYRCTCEDNTKTGKLCNEPLFCHSDPCEYGSKCVENGTDFACECLQYYTGKNCSLPNYCVSSPCNNGDCIPIDNGLDSTFTCECFPGWTGKFCTTDINECSPESNPCEHGGICTQITPPAEPFYHCECVAGTTGQNCETNPDDCELVEKDKKMVSTCKLFDPLAKCEDGFESYTCKCGAEYTGQFCEIELMIYEILMKIYGKVSNEMLGMLKQLLANPSMIKDMVPFILGLEDEASRSAKSWDHEDLFDWAAYEEERLELKRDLVKWNDVTLGNCFTFNHRNNTANNYVKRMIGQEGGFHALMKINGEEYFPWVDTEAIQVFVHPSEDDIFSESVRYNAQPNGETEIYPYLTEYGRLAGKYGVCVDEPKEVKAYYYSGAYTTDGCLRSCYQNAVLEDCDCMDPRYPMPDGVKTCDLQTRNCVEDVTVTRGDPSKWKDCLCPLPCKNRQYSVRWSRSVYVEKVPQCDISILEEIDDKNKQNCSKAVQDTVLVRVTLPGLGFSLFQEEPAMDVRDYQRKPNIINRFIGNLGGLLGVLCGISIITFIEFGFLIIRIYIILISNK